MTGRGSRVQGARRRWRPVFLLCFFALAASVHFYTFYVTKTSTASAVNRAQVALHNAHMAARSNAEKLISADAAQQRSLTVNAAAAHMKYIDEISGVRGIGTSGMSGEGPLAAADLMVWEHDSQALQAVLQDIQAAQQEVASIDQALAAGDSAAPNPQAALAWSLIAVILSGLLTVATGALNARRFAIRQGDHLLWAGLDWRRLYAAGGLVQVLTAMLVGSALSSLVHVDDRERYGEEWVGDMADINGRWRRAWWAITLRIFAPHGINNVREELSTRKY